MKAEKLRTPYEQDRYERGKQVAEQLSRMVNGGSREETQGFVEGILREHNTLQQSMVRVLVEVIYALAEHRFVDGRNERAVELCGKLKQCMETEYGGKPGLPYI